MALGGRTIEELQKGMTQKEFASWVAFYKANPFDDYNRIHRPFAMIANVISRNEVAIEDALDWLGKSSGAYEGFAEEDIASIKALGGRPPVKG